MEKIQENLPFADAAVADFPRNFQACAVVSAREKQSIKHPTLLLFNISHNFIWKYRII